MSAPLVWFTREQSHDSISKHDTSTISHFEVDVTSDNEGGSRLIESSTQAQVASQLLISSPYTHPEHQLRLSELHWQSCALAEALTRLEPIRNDYATATYGVAFNWQEIQAALLQYSRQSSTAWHEKTFYAVVFRSKMRPGTDRSLLAELDEAAHLEAAQSGGLLKYWFGEPDADGRNAATCLWTSIEAAHKGGSGPAHRRARKLTGGLYEEWRFERMELRIGMDVKSWDFIAS
ncbi:hypothetical protein MMC25_006635 [Agyrium rufum]|nr:hypothetical protein [Agyrium rufum]